MTDTADRKMQEREYGFDTLALHAGQEVDSATTATSGNFSALAPSLRSRLLRKS